MRISTGQKLLQKVYQIRAFADDKFNVAKMTIPSLIE